MPRLCGEAAKIDLPHGARAADWGDGVGNEGAGDYGKDVPLDFCNTGESGGVGEGVYEDGSTVFVVGVDLEKLRSGGDGDEELGVGAHGDVLHAGAYWELLEGLDRDWEAGLGGMG